MSAPLPRTKLPKTVPVAGPPKPRIVHAKGNFKPEHGANYTAAQIQFMLAIEAYKRDEHRPFPTWCQVLDVLLGLGYRLPA